MKTSTGRLPKLFSIKTMISAGSQYDFYKAETATKSIIEALSFAEQLFPGNLFIVCPKSHPKFSLVDSCIQYASASCKSILGYTREEIESKTIRDFLDLIHPEDLQGFLKSLNFIEEKEPLDPTQHRVFIYYRMKNKQGEYVYISDEKFAMKNDAGNYVYLAMIKDIGHEQKFTSVKADILKHGKNGYVKIYSYRPQSSTSDMTPRQNDIIYLTQKGLSNKEIAEHLHVSVSTVKNHKQVVFRKANVKTSLELVSVTQQPMIA
jgi:PAS domain S-box-containing protein